VGTYGDPGLAEKENEEESPKNHYIDGRFSRNPYFECEVCDGTPFVKVYDDMRFLELSWGKYGGKNNIIAESRGTTYGESIDRGFFPKYEDSFPIL
jgi:hypothetical protein